MLEIKIAKEKDNMKTCLTIIHDFMDSHNILKE